MTSVKVDFGREVYFLLGLPFDATDLSGAVQTVLEAASLGRRCFVSTPNVNFVAAAHSDPAFRETVLRSGLSLADGMPIVWVARMMGLPLRQRVAGSTVFEALRRMESSRLKVFFFGGADGVAADACARLNAQASGLECVGFESPGFGTVQSISSDQIRHRINASGADFVVVALGAKKGQAWIEFNRTHLAAPVICHLGAVLNFVAGTVRRAPAWMQRSGLEWLWRIKEEPGLWRRYARDAWVLLRLVLTGAIPYAMLSRISCPSPELCLRAQCFVEDVGSSRVLKLEGVWVSSNLTRLRQALPSWIETDNKLIVDLNAVTHVDSAFVGLLSLLWTHQAEKANTLEVRYAQPAVARTIRLCGAHHLLPGKSPISQVSEQPA